MFLYVGENEMNSAVWEEDSWRAWKESSRCSTIVTSDFMYHMNQVPFVWKIYNTDVDMLFVGGMVGVAYDENDKSVAPVFGYGVAEAKINKIER
jgi:hypothetical protein